MEEGLANRKETGMGAYLYTKKDEIFPFFQYTISRYVFYVFYRYLKRNSSGRKNGESNSLLFCVFFPLIAHIHMDVWELLFAAKLVYAWTN